MRQKSKLYLVKSIIELIQTKILSTKYLNRLSIYKSYEASLDQDSSHYYREIKKYNKLL